MTTRRVSIVVPTFEPEFVPNPDVEAFYRANFESFLDPEGDFEATLVLSDFRSSDAFKAFLKGLADEHAGKIAVIDGAHPLGGPQAVNAGLRALEHDLSVYAASDTRCRDRAWLSLLVRDLDDDPSVMASYATTPYESSHLVDQLQPGPIDKPSRPLTFPENAIPNVVVYAKALLGPFGDRWPDYNHLDPLTGMAWQLLAVDGRAVVNYRCNVLHEHFFDEGRYNRTKSTHWHADRTHQNKVKRAALHFLPMPQPRLRPRTPPLLKPLIAGLREGGVKGLARAAYIRWLQGHIPYIVNLMRVQGPLNYLFADSRLKTARDRFLDLDRDQRRRMVEALYFVDEGFYDEIECTVHHSKAGT